MIGAQKIAVALLAMPAECEHIGECRAKSLFLGSLRKS
jgi:hypothetical protein